MGVRTYVCACVRTGVGVMGEHNHDRKNEKNYLGITVIKRKWRQLM